MRAAPAGDDRHPDPAHAGDDAYADLDVSAIDELPPGRTPVTTIAVSAERRAELVERIRAACAEGRQAYWVCTLIDESDEIEAQAAQATFEALQAALPDAHRPGPRPHEGRREAGDDARVQGRRASTCWWPPR
jgi:hypothetical protein